MRVENHVARKFQQLSFAIKTVTDGQLGVSNQPAHDLDTHQLQHEFFLETSRHQVVLSKGPLQVGRLMGQQEVREEDGHIKLRPAKETKFGIDHARTGIGANEASREKIAVQQTPSVGEINITTQSAY